MDFKIVNWNIGGAKYLEKEKKDRKKFREELNNELRTLIKKQNPHVVTLQEIVLYAEPVLSWNEITGKILDTDKKRFIEFLKNHPTIQMNLKNDWLDQESIKIEVKPTHNVVISNGSKSLSIKLNKEKSKALLEIDTDEVGNLIAETKNDIVSIFPDIENIIDPIDKYSYHPFKLIDTHVMSAQAKWNKVINKGKWHTGSYFAQGNAMLFEENYPPFPIWDLSASGFRPNPTTRHFVEQVRLQRGLYFGNRDTEPRAALVTHFIFNPDNSNVFYWNDIPNKDLYRFLDFLDKKLMIKLNISTTKIQLIDDEISLSEHEYLFSWNKIKEKNERTSFLEYLKSNFGIDLMEELTIEEDIDKITIFSNPKKPAKIVIERINDKVKLIINDETKYELFAERDNEEVKIYHNNKISLKLNKEKNEVVLRISSIKDCQIKFIAKKEDDNKFKIIYGKPLDVFVVNLHLTTLTNEREGIPDIDGKASKIRMAQIDIVFEGIISQYNLWKQQGFKERNEPRIMSPGEADKRQSPVWIITGDFNFTPESIEYETIRRMNFIDVLPNKGTGSKAKGMGEKATLTLDYIFAGPLYTALDPVDTLNAIKENGPPDYTLKMSDHYPLIATIVMGNEV